MGYGRLPMATAFAVLVILSSSTLSYAQQVIEVVEYRLIDTPYGHQLVDSSYPHNNGNGVAEPGEFVGYWFLLHIPGGLPENPRVRVKFDDSFLDPGGSSNNSDRGHPEVVDATQKLYSLELSEESVRRIVRLVEGKTTAVLRVELMSSLTIVGHTTCKVPVAGVDPFPPWVLWFSREPERQMEVGETIQFEVYVFESETVTRVQGRILQLPERIEVAQIPFALPVKYPAEVEEAIKRGRWPFEGAWTVDRSGDFILEIVAEDDSGNRTTTSVFPIDQECLITTRDFVRTADILCFGRRTSPIFHNEMYMEILQRNGIPFDLWDIETRGTGGEIWLEYSGLGGAVVLLPGSTDIHTYDHMFHFTKAGGSLLIPAGYGSFSDSVFSIETSQAALLQDFLLSTLEPYSTTSAHQSVTVRGTEEYPLFGDLELTVDRGMPSAIVPAPGVGIALVDPLLQDGAGRVQAVRVQDRGMSIYFNFALAEVADQHVREELFLRSLEELLGMELPRLPITAVLETAQLPTAFALEQNYPNPFNSATVIRFALPFRSAVDLAVFDLAGQKIATLMSGEHQAGTCSVQWNSRDDDGQELASGVYLYRLRAGGGKQVDTRKLLLLQ